MEFRFCFQRIFHAPCWLVILVFFTSKQDGFSQWNRSNHFKQIIQALAHDSMEGRGVGSPSEKKAADYIVQQLNACKLGQPDLHVFHFIHPETKQQIKSQNVYLYVNNRASKTILIGAHYDHIGRGEYKSLSYNAHGQVHNGADDNASGVALLLKLAHTYTDWHQENFNYLFVSFSAHELGLYGSMEFEKFAREQFPPIHLVINFDMVGRMEERDKKLFIAGSSTLSSSDTLFHFQSSSFQIQMDDNDMILQTDGRAFVEREIPALSFTTGTHLDYHKVSDDEEYINYIGLQLIQEWMEEFLHRYP